MNVGCLVDSVSRNAGGLFDAVRRLGQSMQNDCCSVTVFGLEDEHTREDISAWQPVAVRTFPRRLGGWGYSPLLEPALAQARLDVLLVQGLWKYGSKASLDWHRRTRRPHIVHPHGMLDPWAVNNSRWKKRVAASLYENAHLRAAACIRALCEPEVRAIRAYGLRVPVAIIPNGVDLPPEGADGKQDFDLPGLNDRKVLFYLGRLHPKKNLGPLLEAWHRVQQDCTAAANWALVVAGWDQDGHRSELERQVAAFQNGSAKTPSVFFPGPLFDAIKAAAYRRANAFVLPSLSEGLPMTVLEAWSYRCPVLMTRECNLPEGFARGAAVRIGTRTEEMVQGLRDLMEMTEKEREEIGDRGRRLVEQQFLWARAADEMRAVCEWTVGGGSPPPCVRLD